MIAMIFSQKFRVNIRPSGYKNMKHTVEMLNVTITQPVYTVCPILILTKAFFYEGKEKPSKLKKR